MPQGGALRDAALRHLARFGTTRASLLRVLDRRIARWAREQAVLGAPPDRIAADAARAREEARGVADALVRDGVLDDAAFAASRARSLHRSGRSRRAIGAHLAAKGVEADTVDALLEDDADAELDAAVAFARRRKVGPFARAEAEGEQEGEQTDARHDPRILAAFARAGFSRDVAERALGLTAEEAEERVLALRRG
ncbi:RecX family transcriptional regulator [Rhizosaccharibacter radicis]|uniref:Regulatory protein RecX n=1 Tax=Rhizosaccharibacter radicis TaxID=2782605 RepID=A0ABT1W195_9PROT|nr:RecX family transcriptional regulator [Acetobacteraceae bacterium KSS12]